MVGHSGLESDGDGEGVRGRSGRKRIPNRRYMDMEVLSPARHTKRPRQSDGSQRSDSGSKPESSITKAAAAPSGVAELRTSGSSAGSAATSPAHSESRSNKRSARKSVLPPKALPEASSSAGDALSNRSSVGVPTDGCTDSDQCTETLATHGAASTTASLPPHCAAEPNIRPAADSVAASVEEESISRVVTGSTGRVVEELAGRIVEESNGCDVAQPENGEHLGLQGSDSQLPRHEERLESSDAVAPATSIITRDTSGRKSASPPVGAAAASSAAAPVSAAAADWKAGEELVEPVTAVCDTVAANLAATENPAVDAANVVAVTDGEAVTSQSASLCTVAADATVPVDTAILLLATDDAGGGELPAEPCTTDGRGNAEAAVAAGSCDKSAAADAAPAECAVAVGECESGMSVLTAHAPTSHQEVRPPEFARRVTLVAPKALSSSLLSQTTLKALESVRNDAAMQAKDLIVEIVMDPNAPGADVVNVALEGADDQGSAGSSMHQEYDVKYVHVSGDGKEVFRCTQCDYETDRRPNFYKHKKRHLESRPYKCPECEYSARTSSNLKRHVLSHTNERRFPCDQCPLKFRQKIHLEKHVKYIHEAKSVRCTLCDYTCANENPDLKLHMKRKHLTMDPSGQRAVIECDRCGFLAASKRDLKQHYKFHKRGPELKLYCEQCSFVTDCESRLTRHMLTHSKDKPFGCSLCEYKATQREHVQRHMKNIHKIDVPGPAERQKRQRSSSAFQESAVVSPDGQYRIIVSKKYDPPDFTEKQKVFYCHHCTMKFCKLINLYKHLHAQHAHLMPPVGEDGMHGCVLCDFKSTSKKNLLVHMRKHNASALLTDSDGAADVVVPGKVYTCALCDYMNPTRRNLYQHLKKKHKISLMVRRDGTANCIVEPNAAVTVVASDEHQQVTEIIPMMADDGSGSAHSVKGTEVGRVVNIEDLANSLMRPISVPGYTAGMACTVTAGDVEDGVGGSDSDGDDEDDEEDGTAEGEPIIVGAHGIVTAQVARGCISSSGGTAVAPAAEQLVRHQAAEAIVGLAAGAGSSNGNSSAAAASGYPSVMVLTVVGSPSVVGSEGVRHIQLPADVSSQLSSGDIIEMNGEVFKVIVAPQEENDGSVQAAAFGSAPAGTSLLLQGAVSAANLGEGLS